jgi:uncharacterized protein DUF1176
LPTYFLSHTALASSFLLVVLSACSGTRTSREPEKASIRIPQSTDNRAAWRSVLRWSSDCEQSFQATGGRGSGLQFFDLDHDRHLVEVACSSGAYQGSQEYFVIEGRGSSPAAHAISFPTYEATGSDGKTLTPKTVNEITGLPEFDRVHHELKILNRYRGPGDCGSYATYAFESGRAVLKQFRAKLDCDGTGAEHPEQWPIRK